VSCPRSSSHLAAGFWGQQTTETNELVHRASGKRDASQFRLSDRFTQEIAVTL
jgi:hypothetical protein